MYNTTCVTRNRLSNSCGVYTIIQVVHTKFIKLFLQLFLFSLQQFKQNDLRTSCSSSKSRKRRKKEESMWNLGLQEEKTELYETLLAELWLEKEYNYNILLRMTSENFEEIFQLIKNNIPKDNTNLRELILPKL